MTPPADADRIARAALSRVVEPGDPAALDAFAGLTPVETWDLLRSHAPGLERWIPRLDQVDPHRDLDRAHAAGARFVVPGVDLAENGTTVVSGGAYGVDAAAHRGALTASGLTIAVLACGVDVSYPKSNSVLFDRIAAEGLLVSELPPGCSPTKLRFLARNRLIAASTLGTVVVEAAIRSGALNTAGWAEQCSRTVLAVPGAITSRMSEGVHLLIRERNAVLATSVADILEAISPYGRHLTTYPHARPAPTDGLDLDVQRTLDAVPVLRPAPATRIAATAGLDVETVQECLETLDQANLVEYSPTGWRLSPTHRQSLGHPT